MTEDKELFGPQYELPMYIPRLIWMSSVLNILWSISQIPQDHHLTSMLIYTCPSKSDAQEIQNQQHIMFTWLKNLITRPDPETLEAQTRRKKQRRASKNHSRRVQARERELRRQAQGSRRKAPFYLGKGAGMPPPLGAWAWVCRGEREKWFGLWWYASGWTELRYPVKETAPL